MINYIYSIINTENGKRYVGKTSNINHRLAQHLSALQLGTHHSLKFQNAFNKYGKEKFKVECREVNTETEEELNQIEINEIKKYNSYEKGYNMTVGGDGRCLYFDYETTKVIYQISNQYEETQRKLARYFNCNRSVIKRVANCHQLNTEKYDVSMFDKIVKEIGLSDYYLKKNYQGQVANNRNLSKEQVFEVLSTLELSNFSQAACATVLGFKKDTVNNIVNNKTCKKEYAEYQNFTKEQKEKYYQNFIKKYPDIERIHYTNKRVVCKSCLSQEQVNYILDNLKNTNKTQKQIAQELNISTDRVSGVKNRKYYLDLIHNWENQQENL